MWPTVNPGHVRKDLDPFECVRVCIPPGAIISTGCRPKEFVKSVQLTTPLSLLNERNFIHVALIETIFQRYDALLEATFDAIFKLKFFFFLIHAIIRLHYANIFHK